MRLPNFIMCLVLASFFFCSAASAEPVLVANTSVADTFLRGNDIQLIFLGKKKKWSNGDKITVATLKNGPVHEMFLKLYVNKTPAKYSSYWKIAIMTGTGMPPKFFRSEGELLNYVKEKKGAVGYISADTAPDGVNVIVVE